MRAIDMLFNKRPLTYLLTYLLTSIVLTSNLILILYPFGFSSNVHLFFSLQSLTSSTSFSITSGQFHPILKESVISQLLKNSILNKDLVILAYRT